jgi:uncharacterized protein YndB with AHSA1/START domain
MTMTAEQTERANAPGGLSLELTKHFDAKPERVFDAWLGEEWGKWLPPFGATGCVTTMEAKPGGAFVVAMQMPDGRDIEISGKYIEIDRPNKLVMTWAGGCASETLLTIRLRPENNGTLLTLLQEGFVEEQAQQGYTRGWEGEGGSFDKLAKLL